MASDATEITLLTSEGDYFPQTGTFRAVITDPDCDTAAHYNTVTLAGSVMIGGNILSSGIKTVDTDLTEAEAVSLVSAGLATLTSLTSEACTHEVVSLTLSVNDTFTIVARALEGTSTPATWAIGAGGTCTCN